MIDLPHSRVPTKKFGSPVAQPATVHSRAAAHKAGYLIISGVQSMMIPLHLCTTAPAGVLGLDTLTHVFTKP